MRNSMVMPMLVSGLALILIVQGCRSAAPEPGNSSASVSEAKTRQKMVDVEAKHEAVETPPPSKTVGHLTADRKIYDFGRAEPGQRVEGKFVLTNDGASPLEITKVDNDCGCTVPALKTKVLEPGTSTPLEIRYDVGHRSGRQVKKVWLEVKPPAEPKRLTLKLQVDVRKSIDSKPAGWEFELRQSPKNEIPLELASSDGEMFRVTRCVSTGQAVKVFFDPDAEAPKFRLPIKVDFEKLRKTGKGAVTVGLEHPKIKEVTIPFTVTMPFMAVPDVRYFRNLEVGKVQKGNVTVVSNYGEPFEIENIRSEEGLVQVLDYSQREDGYHIELALTPPEQGKQIFVRDYLLIKIKDHPEDTLRVQCLGMIRRGRLPGGD